MLFLSIPKEFIGYLFINSIAFLNETTYTMKNKLCAFVFCSFSIWSFAQVQIDQVIELTGANGDRAMRNLEGPVNGTDAVNKEYVDGLVSASGPSSLTMITDESATTMNFGSAIRYCKNLSEGGYSDWRLPAFFELVELISKGGSSVPNDASLNYFWLADRATASGASSAWRYIQKMELGTGEISISFGSELNRTRCVR